VLPPRKLLLICLLATVPFTSPDLAAEPKPEPKPKPLLIIAPESLAPALKEFVEYKKQVLPTRLESLEHVLATSDGFDDPEKIKRFAYNAWKEHRLGYLLLVGDRDAMPIRFLTSLKFSTFDYLFMPTDLYYSDLAKDDGSFEDWNANKASYHKGYFGEVTGEKGSRVNVDEIHYRPQIAVGRWPVSTPEKVKIIADKSIAYEKSIRDGTHPGMRTAAFFHPQGWIDAREDLSHAVRSLPPRWKGEQFFYRDDEPRYKTPVPTEDRIVHALNQGLGLCVHVGHGETESWLDYPAFVDNKDKTIFSSYHSIALLKNADRLPVMISIGCSTAYFTPLGPNEAYIDVSGKEHPGEANKETFTGPPPPPSPYQKGKIVHQSLGKKILEAGPNGAVAYIGSDMVAQPPALGLLDAFITAMRTSYQPRVGDCWSFAINRYHDDQNIAKLKTDGDWVIPATFMQPMKFNLFGDPSLPLAPTEHPTK
jgi:hypothetical protein